MSAPISILCKFLVCLLVFNVCLNLVLIFFLYKYIYNWANI